MPRSDENDLWIAEAATSLGATLVTSDSDFSRLPGITPVDYSQKAQVLGTCAFPTPRGCTLVGENLLILPEHLAAVR